jgi:hypothetical protein
MIFFNITNPSMKKTAYPNSLPAKKIQIDSLGHTRPAND